MHLYMKSLKQKTGNTRPDRSKRLAWCQQEAGFQKIYGEDSYDILRAGKRKRKNECEDRSYTEDRKKVFMEG